MRVALAVLTVVIGVVYVLALPNTVLRHLPADSPIWNRIADEADAERAERD